MKKLLCIITAVIFFIIISRPMFPDEETAEILYEKGLADFNGKNYESAETAFLKAVEAFPGHLKSLVKLAELCELDGEKQAAAIEYYTRINELLSAKEKLSADEKKLKQSAEKKLDELDKLGAEYKSERANYLKALTALAGDAKKDNRPDLLGRIYDEILIVDPKNQEALKGKKELEKTAGGKKADPEKKPAAGKKEPSQESQLTTELFNGKDMKVWKNDIDAWTVKNGIMYVSSSEFAVATYRDKAFNDKFTVEMEFKTDSQAGIVFGFASTSENYFVLSCSDDSIIIFKFEAKKISNTKTKFVPEAIRTCMTDELDPDGWNTMFLQVDGNSACASLNGKECMKDVELEGKVYGKIGVIGGFGEVWVKGIKTTEPAKEDRKNKEKKPG